jgi:hypothetical protein
MFSHLMFALKTFLKGEYGSIFFTSPKLIYDI